MSEVITEESKERAAIKKSPHYSYSSTNKYLLCPEQYRLYYIEQLRPKIQSANLVFGKVIHRVLEHLVITGIDPVKFFVGEWDKLKEVPLRYSKKESWEKLSGIGEGLLRKFQEEALPKLGKVEATEKPFEFKVTGLPLPFIGFMDLIAEIENKRTVVDYKTSASSYGYYEVALSDQLTAYQLAEPDVEQAAFCVLVKTKTPKIEWHFSRREPEALIAYIEKLEFVSAQIEAGNFYKRPGMWCSYCDYLMVCMGNKKKVQETLVQISPNTSS